MNQIYKGLFLILLLFISAFSYAQKGIIRGTVIDDATGETLIGVTVIIKGTTNGAITDFDGNFEISVEPGAHDVAASYVSYAATTVAGVVRRGRWRGHRDRSDQTQRGCPAAGRDCDSG
jgi:hypothetical protein